MSVDEDTIPIPPHLRGLGPDLTIHDWRKVIRRLRADPSVKLVALVAVTYGNKDGTKIHPGISKLANVCNIDDRTAKVALTKLRALGLLHRTVEGSQYGRRGGISDEHVATVPRDPTTLPLLPADESDPEREAKRNGQRAKDAARKRARKAPAPPPPDEAPTREQVISDSEQVISDPGSGDLSSRNPGTQITPPVPGPVPRPSHRSHHSDASRRDRAAAPPIRPETFAEFEQRHRAIMIRDGEELSSEDKEHINSTIARDYVISIVGNPKTGAELNTIEGMIANRAHPKAIVNTVLKRRGESTADHRRATQYLQSLPNDVRQAYQDAAEHHVAAHFPDAGPTFATIWAARLAKRSLARQQSTRRLSPSR